MENNLLAGLGALMCHDFAMPASRLHRRGDDVDSSAHGRPIFMKVHCTLTLSSTQHEMSCAFPSIAELHHNCYLPIAGKRCQNLQRPLRHAALELLEILLSLTSKGHFLKALTYVRLDHVDA